MPRLWINAVSFRSVLNEPGSPDVKRVLRALYGPTWRREAARHLGRTMPAVENWVKRNRLPVEIRRLLIERCSDPRRQKRVAERIAAEVKAELAYRAEAQAWALRWLRLMRDGG